MAGQRKFAVKHAKGQDHVAGEKQDGPDRQRHETTVFEREISCDTGRSRQKERIRQRRPDQQTCAALRAAVDDKEPRDESEDLPKYDGRRAARATEIPVRADADTRRDVGDVPGAKAAIPPKTGSGSRIRSCRTPALKKSPIAPAVIPAAKRATVAAAAERLNARNQIQATVTRSAEEPRCETSTTWSFAAES